MNKLTSSFIGALLLIGCAHTSTQAQTVPVVAAPVASVAPVAPGPVEQEEARPHVGPFQGKNWTLVVEADSNWIGIETETGMIAINPIEKAKIILVVEPETDKSLAGLVARVTENLKSHEVKVSKHKNITVNGIKGVELDTAQGGLTVYVSLFQTTDSAYLFGCAGKTANKGIAKTCSEVRSQLHLTK